MKQFFSFAGRMFLMKTVFELLSALLLLFIILDTSSVTLRVLISIVAIGAYTLIIFEFSSKQGTKDAIVRDSNKKKKEQGEALENRFGGYSLYKGFLASALGALPAIILMVVTTALLLKGKDVGSGFHFVLTLLNTIFVPIFQLIPTGNIQLNLNIIPGDVGIYAMLNSQRPILPTLFLIPQLYFILSSGVCYILGERFRQNLKPNSGGRRKQKLWKI